MFLISQIGPSSQITTPSTAGMDFLTSGRGNMRRYSAAALYASSGVPATCNSRGPSPAGSASSLLQQIGSGVVSTIISCRKEQKGGKKFYLSMLFLVWR